MIKVLIVGDFISPIHEQALYDAFVSLGTETYRFSWGQYFKGYQSRRPKNLIDVVPWLYYRFQNKFIFGPVFWEINRHLVKSVKEIRPDLVFIYRGTHIFPETITTLKGEGVTVFGYNNDDPFSGKYPWYIWRNFKRCMPFYDHIFAYRPKNISDYKNIGYAKISLLRSYYIKERNFHVNKPTDRYKCDVVFAGHYEDDGRDEYIKAVIDAGIDFRLYGPEWRRSKYYGFFRSRLGEIYSLNVDDYNLALNSAKIALVFLSKLNSDTYTRRCFEIVAVGTFMLSQYTDDLNGMFEKGKEADYFLSKEEMIDKIRYYLENDSKRKNIARTGYKRLIHDRHEVTDRAKEILKVFEEYRR